MTIKFQSPIVFVVASAIILTSCAVSKDTAMKEKNTSRIMHRVIDAWIDIDAPPEEVWEVLVDFKSWEAWNSFIPKVEGKLQVGERLRIKVVPPEMKPMIFKPEVYEVIPFKKILWGGSFLKIIYRGDHAFLLELTSDGKTRFRQIERFRGPMVLFMGSMIKKTEVGYHQMNLAFKEQVKKYKSEKKNEMKKHKPPIKCMCIKVSMGIQAFSRAQTFVSVDWILLRNPFGTYAIP